MGFIPTTKHDSQFEIVMWDLYTKLSKELTTTKTSDTTVARFFLERLVAKFGVPSKPVINNGFQFVSKFFAAVYSTLRTNNITTTEYHSQIYSQAEHFIYTLTS